jgi:hypothetical protein
MRWADHSCKGALPVVGVFDLETSKTKRPRPQSGSSTTEKKVKPTVVTCAVFVVFVFLVLVVQLSAVPLSPQFKYTATELTATLFLLVPTGSTSHFIRGFVRA